MPPVTGHQQKAEAGEQVIEGEPPGQYLNRLAHPSQTMPRSEYSTLEDCCNRMNIKAMHPFFGNVFRFLCFTPAAIPAIIFELGQRREGKVMPLLYVDMLGVKARWLKGGHEAAVAAFETLEELVKGRLHSYGKYIISGGVETDCIAVICEPSEACIQLGIDIFKKAFSMPHQESGERIWLRGAIIPVDPSDELRKSSRLSDSIEKVFKYYYTDSLLEAIALEKSGYKGMRLLIANSLVTKQMRDHFGFKLGNGFFIPFRALNHSVYPERVKENYQDILWMVESDKDRWERMKQLMASRLRWSSRIVEEFLQAAATQLVFHECSAIAHTIEKRKQ